MMHVWNYHLAERIPQIAIIVGASLRVLIVKTCSVGAHVTVGTAHGVTPQQIIECRMVPRSSNRV
jgi:hypothetical protein